MVMDGFGPNTKYMDLYSRMMQERILFLEGPVESQNINTLVAAVLYLDHIDNTKPIQLYINSPGGSVSDGLILIDTLTLCKSPIITICTGMAASMGAMILSDKYNNKKGNVRKILPNARVMIHSIATSSGYSKIQDIRIDYKELERYQEKLMKMLAKNTGNSYEQIVKDCDRDKYMSPEEALEYGLVDEICS